jgi:PAS domain-containing protein
MGIINNITERKQAEEALLLAKNITERNEILLKKIAENYPNSFVSIIEKDLTIGFTSGQGFKQLNLNPNDFIGLTIEQVFGEFSQIVKENYLKTFNGKESSFEININSQYQLYKTVPLFDEQNSITRILAVVENITERKQAEIALHDKMIELEKFNTAMVGREIKMIELKKEINDLLAKLNLPKKYSSPESVV